MGWHWPAKITWVPGVQLYIYVMYSSPRIIFSITIYFRFPLPKKAFLTTKVYSTKKLNMKMYPFWFYIAMARRCVEAVDFTDEQSHFFFLKQFNSKWRYYTWQIQKGLFVCMSVELKQIRFSIETKGKNRKRLLLNRYSLALS